MRKALAILLIAVTMPTYPGGLVRDELLFVSMHRLLAVPAAYDGKKVLLNGYLRIGDRSGALFVNETALRYGPKMDGVYVDLTPEQIKEYQSVSKKWVMIEGTFTQIQNEIAPDFAGKIESHRPRKRMDGDGGSIPAAYRDCCSR